MVASLEQQLPRSVSILACFPHALPMIGKEPPFDLVQMSTQWQLRREIADDTQLGHDLLDVVRDDVHDGFSLRCI